MHKGNARLGPSLHFTLLNFRISDLRRRGHKGPRTFSPLLNATTFFRCTLSCALKRMELKSVMELTKPGYAARRDYVAPRVLVLGLPTSASTSYFSRR